MAGQRSDVAAAIEAIRRGELVVVVSAADRWNESDILCAAEKISPAHVRFMFAHGRGQLCMPILPDVCHRLDLPPLLDEPQGTEFTVSVDHRSCRTGISAEERVATILAIVSPASEPTDFVRPGHLFPIVAQEGGVLRRAAAPEAAVDLARIAGLRPAGVLCELLDKNGDPAAEHQVYGLAQQHALPIITIEDLIHYRRHRGESESGFEY